MLPSFLKHQNKAIADLDLGGAFEEFQGETMRDGRWNAHAPQTNDKIQLMCSDTIDRSSPTLLATLAL